MTKKTASNLNTELQEAYAFLRNAERAEAVAERVERGELWGVRLHEKTGGGASVNFVLPSGSVEFGFDVGTVEEGRDFVLRVDRLCERTAVARRAHLAEAAHDPRAFAAIFGRRITGTTAHGYRSRKAR